MASMMAIWRLAIFCVRLLLAIIFGYTRLRQNSSRSASLRFSVAVYSVIGFLRREIVHPGNGWTQGRIDVRHGSTTAIEQAQHFASNYLDRRQSWLPLVLPEHLVA